MKPCDAQGYIKTVQTSTFISLCVLFTHLDVSDIIRIPIYFFLVMAFPGVATKAQKVSPNWWEYWDTGARVPRLQFVT